MKNIIATTILALAILTAAPAHGQALKGLGAVTVQVQIIPKYDDLVGLIRQESIQTQAELELRKAGIKVVEKAPALFYVAIGLLGDSKTVIVKLDFQLKQWVYLSQRNVINAITWSRSYVGHGGKSQVKEQTSRVVGEFLDEFLNDYLKANPVNP